MRKSTKAGMRGIGGAAISGLICLLAGCAGPGQAALTGARKAVAQGQPDQAIAQTDAYLKQSPRGREAAEVLYLRGRAYEQRVAHNPQEAAANLQAARTAYIDALGRSPRALLEAYIRTGLGNVAYFQDDYVTAVEQLGRACDRLDKPELKSGALYRLGVSQQRLGRFVDADRTFAMVQQQFPRSELAGRARQHMGARVFYVQLGAFSSAAGADKAAAGLRREGVTPLRLMDGKGLHLLRVGPYATYAQARAAKARLANQYPDAMILP